MFEPALRLLLDTAFGLVTYALPAALRDAVAARPVPQSAGTGGRGAHGLGGEARAPRGPGLQGRRRVHAGARVGRANSRGSARSRSSWTGRVRRRGRWRRSRFSRASSSSRRSIWLLIIVVIAQAILSWVAPDGPFAGVLNAMTFRFLAPIRRRVPPLGGTLDLSPLILIVALQLMLHRFPSAGSRARCSCCSGEAHVHCIMAAA